MIGPRGAVGKRSVEIETDVRVPATTCVAAGSAAPPFSTREGEQTFKVMNINGEHRVSDEASTANLPCFQRAHITLSAL